MVSRSSLGLESSRKHFNLLTLSAQQLPSTICYPTVYTSTLHEGLALIGFWKEDVGFVVSIVLEIKPGPSYTLDKCFTRELLLQPRSIALEWLFSPQGWPCIIFEGLWSLANSRRPLIQWRLQLRSCWENTTRALWLWTWPLDVLIRSLNTLTWGRGLAKASLSFPVSQSLLVMKPRTILLL